MKKALITGGAGFVGSHLAERMIRGGYGVVVVDNFSNASVDNVDLLRALAQDKGVPFTFHETDVRDPRALGRAFDERDIESCFHLAAIVDVQYSMTHDQETSDVNIGGTKNTVLTALARGLCRIVNAGSAAEYGNAEILPIKEEHAREGVQLSPYGRTKFEAEQLLLARPTKTRVVSVRPFNIFGPRQDPKSPYSGVISIFIDKAVAGEPLPINGDGGQTRDFIYVGDMVNAYLAAAGYDHTSQKITKVKGPFREASEPRVYNIGAGCSVSINQLARVVNEICHNDAGVVYRDAKPGEIRHSVADISRAQQHLGWFPTQTTGQALEGTVAYLGKHALEHVAD
ncbi:NAD-dependent epimerase/dehydratase family protein [Candidatus Woesearchaeota archaeon]|nr:NAD-dependent epimerase/dehydratase family protein [Candidatus Woesearchaeota archaeon]